MDTARAGHRCRGMVDRIRSWRRRPVGHGQRLVVLAMTSVGTAVAAGILTLLVAVAVQPSFTRLEQSAVRLVPPEWDAQPPVEIVPGLGAFRRSYRVAFVPAAGDTDVSAARVRAVLADRAAQLGWQRVSTGPDRTTFRRAGVRAVVSTRSDTVVTSLAPQVARLQRVAVIAAAIAGGVIAPTVVARRWRRRPHPVG